MRRFVVAAAALAAAVLTSGGLLLAAGRGQAAGEVYVLARDLPAGAPLTPDSLKVERLQLGAAAAAAVAARPHSAPPPGVAAHDLHAGQLLQRSDLAAAGNPVIERRSVFVPLKDVPAAVPGGRVDLFAVTGPPDRQLVSPVALDLEIRSVSPAGLVVSVAARQAPALVYAAGAVRLVAATADPGAHRSEEAPVATLEQAVEALRR